MPRKLPWATKDTPVPKEKRPRPVTRKREASSSDPEQVARMNSGSSTPLKTIKKRVSYRTPSTSPPPGPPDEEYMVKGYDHDDIYIMVEDEFHSVAQTFTRHLHHAEYQRLKKKARDAAPPTFRPTDQMRTEVKKKLEARALHAKQKDAVRNITTGINLSAEEDEEQDDDPWLGTSLAGLMTDANIQKRTALVGLEKMQSTTRAAKGFGRGMGDSPPSRKGKMGVLDIFAEQRKEKENAINEQEREGVENDPNHSRRVQSTASIVRPQESSRNEKLSTKREADPNPTRGLTKTTNPPSIKNAADPTSHSRFREPSIATRKLFDEFDDFDHTASIIKRPKASPSRKDHKRKQTKDRKLQMNDIPTFLV
ncbi:hypothetical protein GJ744_011187 [Endocarpon pusillum]|uniref:Uncharacterized protein n=1 Tax=Endocarpon pusillum TaxID=364733 RepID=A0A8H7AGW3_9EURO|nr:hypothetical protein GJ744_011187 [Endocarpon pusillum]